MIGRAVKRRVHRRAAGYCEYCRLHADLDALPHHVDHIIAQKHLGSDAEDNLALACANCSLGKGPNLSGVDPRTGKITRLFHPRTDPWQRHFRWDEAALVGKTAIGRVTVLVHNINQPDRVAFRKRLIDQGLFPPPDD